MAFPTRIRFNVHRSIPRGDSVTCSICKSACSKVFNARILGKYEVDYFVCGGCGFLRTERPYWLEEAYSRPIVLSDTGLVARNVAVSRRLASLLYFGLGDRGDGCWLDVAGGFGLLTRLMRDLGFDFRWLDKHTQNLLAPGFDHRHGSRYSGITAIEVLEHIEDPLAFTRSMLDLAGSTTMIFTTELYSGPPPRPDTWPYYGFHCGQHISFYTANTLRALATALNLKCVSAGGLHVLSARPPRRTLLALLSGRFSHVARLWAGCRLQSLTAPDQRALAKSAPGSQS